MLCHTACQVKHGPKLQSVNCHSLPGLQGVFHIRDKFIVFGIDNTEYDRALENLSNDSENVVAPSTQRNANFVYLRLNFSDLCFQKME